uniref:RRM domain-containing protein n=1 Tax=Ditylenchus dipsaci TaxID=166011 RepID=A0A915EW01_9BILA
METYFVLLKKNAWCAWNPSFLPQKQKIFAVHLENIDAGITPNELRDFLGELGHIADVNFNKGFAKVIYNSQEEADQAVNHFNDKKLRGKALKASLDPLYSEGP